MIKSRNKKLKVTFRLTVLKKGFFLELNGWEYYGSNLEEIGDFIVKKGIWVNL